MVNWNSLCLVCSSFGRRPLAPPLPLPMSTDTWRIVLTGLAISVSLPDHHQAVNTSAEGSRGTQLPLMRENVLKDLLTNRQFDQ
jgi:hypothetical protein